MGVVSKGNERRNSCKFSDTEKMSKKYIVYTKQQQQQQQKTKKTKKKKKKKKQGPVVQRVVSLTSSLGVKMLTVLVSTISNSQAFLL